MCLHCFNFQAYMLDISELGLFSNVENGIVFSTCDTGCNVGLKLKITGKEVLLRKSIKTL